MKLLPEVKKVKYPQLDALRFFSVAGVMISHWFSQFAFTEYIPFGDGVLLFFVLSGYLIGNILLEQKESIEVAGDKLSALMHAFKTFYTRRTLRIFPTYYATIFIFYFLKLPSVKDNLVWFLTYTVNFRVMQLEYWLPGSGHMWSLAIEEQFYIVFPFLVFFTPKKYLKGMLFAMIVTGIFSKIILWALNYSLFDISLFSLSSVDYLGIGALLAWLQRYTNVAHRLFEKRKLLLSSSLLILSIVLYLRYHFANALFICVLVPMAFAYFAWTCILICSFGATGRAKKILEWPLFLFLGQISYGLYLYHNLVPTLDILLIRKMTTIDYLQWTSSALGQAFVHFVFTVVLAILSFRFFEQPISNLKKYFEYRL